MVKKKQKYEYQCTGIITENYIPEELAEKSEAGWRLHSIIRKCDIKGWGDAEVSINDNNFHIVTWPKDNEHPRPMMIFEREIA